MAALTAAAGGCMPWLMGESAEPVAPGAVRLDGGLALLAAPYEPWRPLPVPQARLAVGLVAGVDGALSYAPPLTGHGRLRVRLRDGGPVVAGAVGWGVHAVPDVMDLGEPFVVPFATAELQLSGSGGGARWHGTLRAIVPYYAGEPAAATLWLAPQAGVSLEAGGLRWTPELGAVIPTVHPGQTQLVLGIGLTGGGPRGREGPGSVP